jgi:hypothetical protein
MTSIHTYDPADGTAKPELPPLPMDALAVGTAELLQQAADLPQPRYISISMTQTAALQFAPEQASIRAITRWALRFGSVMTSQPGECHEGPGTWHRAEFDYNGIAVTAYAHVPAAPAST